MTSKVMPEPVEPPQTAVEQSVPVERPATLFGIPPELARVGPPQTAVEQSVPVERPATLFGIPPELARAELNRSVADLSERFGYALLPEEPATVEPEGDTEVLRRLLADQRAATLDARSRAVDLEKLLQLAQGALVQAEARAPSVPKAKSEGAKPQLRPDAMLVNVQWERTQKQLHLAKIAQQRASAQAAATLARANEALRLAKEERHRESLESRRRFRGLVLRGIGATVAVASVAGAGFLLFSYWPRLTSSKAAVPEPVVDAPVVTLQGKPSPLAPSARAVEPLDISDFSRGITRLSAAFVRFPGVDPETVMRAVNKRVPPGGSIPCTFVWNNGEPALQFGNRDGAGRSLAGALSRCAEAVEHFQ